MHSGARQLLADLQRIFAARLQSLVSYEHGETEEHGLHTLALVDSVTFHDLAACVPLAPGWRRAGVAVPLLLTRDEFTRTLDVFPIEYGTIIERHEVIFGRNPFAGMQVSDADLRRACESQAKSHLIHLREGYLETAGQPKAVTGMIAGSAAALGALLSNLERLDPGIAARAGLTPDLLGEIRSAGSDTITEPSALLSRYLRAVEQLWQQVDRWRA